MVPHNVPENFGHIKTPILNITKFRLYQLNNLRQSNYSTSDGLCLQVRHNFMLQPFELHHAINAIDGQNIFLHSFVGGVHKNISTIES